MFDFNQETGVDNQVERAFTRSLLAVMISLVVMAPLLRAYRHLSSKSTSYIKYEMIVIFERAQLLQQQFQDMTLRTLVAFQSKVQAAYLVTLQEYDLLLLGWGQDGASDSQQQTSEPGASAGADKDAEDSSAMEETYRETMAFLQKGNRMDFLSRWYAQLRAQWNRLKVACGIRHDARTAYRNPDAQDRASQLLTTLLVPLEHLLENVNAEVAQRKAEQRQVYEEYMQQALADLPWYKRPAARTMFKEAEARRAKRLNEYVLLDTMSRDELITYYRDKMVRVLFCFCRLSSSVTAHSLLSSWVRCADAQQAEQEVVRLASKAPVRGGVREPHARA